MSAQAGVFDAEAAQEASARREPRPAAADKPVTESREVKPVESAPVVAEVPPAQAEAAAEANVETKPETKPEPAQAPQAVASTVDIFAKPAPAVAVENPFGPTPHVLETKPADPFASAPAEASVPAQAAAEAEPEAAELSQPLKPAAIASTPEATAVEPIKAEPAAAATERAEPVAIEAEPVKTEAVEPTPAATAVSAATAATPAPTEKPAAPATSTGTDALKPMLETAGLVWVGTDANKLREASAAAASEPQPARVPRERKPLPPLDSAPMQQVETGKDAH
jgi:ribonuclease E